MYHGTQLNQLHSILASDMIAGSKEEQGGCPSTSRNMIAYFCADVHGCRSYYTTAEDLGTNNQLICVVIEVIVSDNTSVGSLSQDSVKNSGQNSSNRRAASQLPSFVAYHILAKLEITQTGSQITSMRRLLTERSVGAATASLTWRTNRLPNSVDDKMTGIQKASTIFYLHLNKHLKQNLHHP